MADIVKPHAAPLSPDDALPPVQPPSAGFIVQLFVIPGVIVTIIVAVYLMFNWLAQMGNNPQSYIESLEKGGPSRWQAAISLSNTLRDERYDELKEDPTAMRRLAAILDHEIELANKDDESLRLRIYLCQALGYFRIADGLPALLNAATTQRDDKELPIRLSAIQGLGNLANNIRQSHAEPLQSSKLNEALDQLSRDPEAEVRSRVATVYGVLGDERSQARLKIMLNDDSPFTRYNAAVGLARNGDKLALPVLTEMIDPSLVSSQIVIDQKLPPEELGHPRSAEAVEAYLTEARSNTLASIQVLGLDGLESYAAAKPAADRQEITAAINQLIGSKPRSDVTTHARAVLGAIGKTGQK